MLWRFSASHTHLYPGARLYSAEGPGDVRLSPGDAMLVEFSDGVRSPGRVVASAAEAAVLQMPAHRTRRGAEVAARTWRLVCAGAPGSLCVQRLPASGGEPVQGQ